MSKSKPSPDSPSLPPPRYRPFLHYETLVWLIYGTLTLLSIIDRFTWNVWPRQVHSIGAGSAGTDFIDGIKPGPWAVQTYDILARISGRFSILSLNLLLLTMSHTTYSFLASSFVARYILDMRDYIPANRRLHKYNGIALALLTLIHVWSIIFPCIFHNWSAQVVLGAFEWPLSERNPPGFKDINLDTKTMSLQGDDVFRIVEMTILLAILLPLSVHWFSTRWHLGIQLHSLINILYFIDIVRRHTHPHSWFLNTPFFLLWVLDLIVGVYYKRENPAIFRKHLSEDYMLLFWNQLRSSDTVGPKYYLKLKESSLLERAHVFTGFENRSNLDLADGNPWSACLLVRVYHSKRRPRLGRKDKYSHTQRMAESTDLEIWTWGPFMGEMSEKVRVSLESGARGVTVVAGGSAAGYMIDAIQRYVKSGGGAGLTCLYTARDEILFDWVVDVVGELLGGGKGKGVNVIIALTDGGEEGEEKKKRVEDKQRKVGIVGGSSSEEEEGSWNGRYWGALRVQYGRLNFEKMLPEGDVVYFQGSGGLQGAVQKGCKARKCRLVAGPAYDQESGGKGKLLRALKFNCLGRKGEVV